MAGILLTLLILMNLFLILLVLVQRGKGGGLAGALGGMGGQSAFGTKAGDTFTKVTMWTAFLWIVLCVVSVKLLTHDSSQLDTPDGFNPVPGAASTAPKQDGGESDAATGDESSSNGTESGQPATPAGGSTPNE